jgi:hypothetical protein
MRGVSPVAALQGHPAAWLPAVSALLAAATTLRVRRVRLIRGLPPSQDDKLKD